MKKIIGILIVMLILILLCANFSFATTSLPVKTETKISSEPSSALRKQKRETTSSIDEDLGDLDAYKGEQVKSPKFQGIANKIFGVLQFVGIILSVVVLIIIGIKYMLGSIEEKAEYKKTLIPYIIGAAILFSGSILPQIIYRFSQNL